MTINKLRSTFIRLLQLPLSSIESIFIGSQITTKFNWSPIFIVGPPRSGTTLVYQLVTQGLKLCYFTNLASALYESPFIASLLSLPLINSSLPYTFQSNYGETSGWHSPSQAWRVWSRWFPEDQTYVGEKILTSTAKREIHNTIAYMQRIFDAPFVNKWQGLNSLILPLNEVFPESIFIRVRRNPVQTAQSILIGRKKLYGDIGTWMSTKTKAFDQIIKESSNPVEQICRQLYHIKEDIDRDSKAIGSERFFDIRYEEVCNNPRKFINNFAHFYSTITLNEPLSKRRDVANSFECSTSINVSESDYKAIQKYIPRFYSL